MHLSEPRRADANQVKQVLVQYKDFFSVVQNLIVCRCPFEDNFPISLSQLIQIPCYAIEAEYESSIKIHQTKKNY